MGKELTNLRFARTAASSEKNTQSGGRSGSGTPKKPGPVMRGGVAKNPLSGGGINRATKGRS